MNQNILSKEGYLIHKKSNENIIDKLKEELTVIPFMPFNKNIKQVPFPVYLENDKYLCVPKYYGLEKFGLPNKNKELKGLSTTIEFKGTLRPKQLLIMDTVLDKLERLDGGLISLGCGQGKTVLSLYIACKLKVKTLVIVHKSFLLNQWLQRATEFTTAKIGIIQQNKIEIEGNDIVIGMLQSIAKDKYDTSIFKDFGLVIFDEAHHAPSKYFSRALPIIACKKTLALSATPNRSDKLEKVLYWYFGNIIYEAEPEKNKNVLVKIIKYNIEHPNFKEYKQNFGEDINRPKTINKLIQIDKRNKFIIDNIKEILLEEERKLLILSDRVEHLNILKNLLDNALSDISTSYYIGGLKQKVLDESEKAQVIFATYSMAAEALDIPTLNTLIMVTPRKEVEQAVGRITRKTDHPVQPLIIDIVDQLPSFVRQGYCRRRFYNKKGFINKLIEVENNIIINESEIKQLVIDTTSDEFID